MKPQDLCFTTAVELARMLKRKQVSAREVMQAHLDQIQRCNPRVNAIVTQLKPEQALEQADLADKALASGSAAGALHGLPVVHKDLFDTKDMRTTYGSPIFAEHVPGEDALIVQRLKAAGAISLGKSNTPEFGAGSQTFNPVFGPTLNPYDTGKTCGGSSGGGAVALACGMAPLADGSDLGGSLRNPGNFNNVVGFRPSPGRVPVYPAKAGWFNLSVQGPMARTVEDAALMLSVIAGPDARSPIGASEPGVLFAQPLHRDFRFVRAAWSTDLGGLPVDPRVTTVLEGAREPFLDLGLELEEAAPDFSGADEAFKAWRGWHYQLRYGALLEVNRERMKDTVIWNIEQGQKLTGAELGRAEVLRTELYHRISGFLERYEYLICPVNQVPPFDVNTPYVTEINGQKLDTYVDWMRSAYYISVTGLPAISVPCGFTPEGLPVGVQIVGRHRDDFGVLQLAYAFQQATQVWRKRPSLAE